jgi:hypothetical protein
MADDVILNKACSFEPARQKTPGPFSAPLIPCGD